MSRPAWKVCGRRDPQLDAEAQQWIETVVGGKFPPVPYEDALRNGIILCKLMNKLQPGVIRRINTGGSDYKLMENVNNFISACKAYGVPESDIFQTADLWEKKNVAYVTQTLFALGRTTYTHPEWPGPWLGPRPAMGNKREFSEEKLRAGQGFIGLQAGPKPGSVATQSGQNFGASRKIVLGK